MNIDKKTIRNLFLIAAGCILIYFTLNETSKLKAAWSALMGLLSPFLLGAAIAFGMEWGMYNGMIQRIAEVDSLKLFTFVPFETLLIPMIAVFAFAGMFVGIVGSWTSIRKFMDV